LATADIWLLGSVSDATYEDYGSIITFCDDKNFRRWGTLNIY